MPSRPMQHTPPSTLLPFFVLLGLLQPILAKNGTSQTNPTTATLFIHPYARNRIFSVSDASPIATVLNTCPHARYNTARITAYFSSLDRAVRESISETRNLSNPRPHPLFPVCNNHNQPWKSGSSNYINHRGWPLPGQPSCITDVFGLPQSIAQRGNPPFSAPELHAIIVQEAVLTNQHADSIRALVTPNWTYAEKPFRHSYTRGPLTCTLDNVAGFRIGGQWHVSVQVTNRRSHEWVRDWERAYVDEYVRPVSSHNNRLVAARMALPMMPRVGHRDGEPTHVATTVVVRWAGAAHPSQFYSMNVGENVALQDAVQQGQMNEAQVGSAMTMGNVGILALPLVLNLVPLAVLADVGRVVAIWYVVLSRTITALPIVIKGIELIGISRMKFHGMVSRVGDTSAEGGTTVAAEVWVAECGMERSVRRTGVLFVAVGMSMMVIGMTIEAAARRACWGARREWIYSREWKENFAAMCGGQEGYLPVEDGLHLW